MKRTHLKKLNFRVDSIRMLQSADFTRIIGGRRNTDGCTFTDTYIEGGCEISLGCTKGWTGCY